MTAKSVSKLRRLATALLEFHSLGKKLTPFLDIFESTLLIDAGLEKNELSPLMEQLQELKIIDGFVVSEVTFGNDYTVFFPDDFREVAATFINRATTDSQEKIQTNFDLYSDRIKEFSADKLTLYTDGTITYDDSLIDIPNRIHTLCVLFMKENGRQLTYDDIIDQIIPVEKRDENSRTTIQKYVNMLQKVLNKHYGRDVITNVPKTGYIFTP